MPTSLQFPDTPPRFEVWNHLHSGLDLARMEFDDLGKREKEALDNFAEVVFARRAALTAPPEDQEVHELEGRLLEHPWFKHAADIRFAEEAVWRGTGALSRYLELRPILTRLQLSQRSQTYLGEAVQTFLFHFDAACIAFCEATLEQVLKEALVRSGVYTDRQLRRDQPTGMSLLIKAKGLLTDSYDLAKNLIEERNRVMHRDMGDQQALHDRALGSIAALGATLQQLGRVLGTH
jgi:hypothetical protein